MDKLTIVEAFKALEEIDDSAVTITPKEEKKVVRESINEAVDDYYVLSDGLDPRKSIVYNEIEDIDAFIAKLSELEFKEYRELLHYVKGDAHKIWSTKEGRIEESCTLDEVKDELFPKFDSRQSFYGKARVIERGDNDKVLYSYGSAVCQIKDNQPYLLVHVDGYASYRSSQTTLRHVKEFLRQNGFKADSLKQIEKDYPIQKDILKEDYNDLEDSWDSICRDVIAKVKEVLGKDIKASDIEFDDSRAHSLFIRGSVLGLNCNKFGAYRNYLGGGMFGNIEHNGREEDKTVELGKFFADTLKRVEDLIGMESEETDESLKESTLVKLSDKDAVKDAKEALDNDEKKAPVQQIVDADAETIDKLKDSYLGNAILRCNKCMTPFFRKPEQLSKDEVSELYNVGEACPHCGNTEGFELIGQVGNLNVDKEPEETAGADEKVPEVDTDKPTADETPTEEEPKRTTEIEVKEESLEKIENLDETGFDTLINKYLKETYENVESYTTTKGSINESSLELTGNIKYVNGKEKEVKFVLENKKVSGNKLRLVGMNESLSDNKKAFTFVASVKDNNLVCEAFSYNYSTKVDDAEKIIRGRHFLEK